MKIVFAGTPEVAVPTLEGLVSSGHEVALVITRPDAPFGRKRELKPSPVATAAEALGLPVMKTASFSRDTGDSVIQALSPLGADLGVVVAFGGLIPDPALSIPRLGWLNLHFSLLPAYRGASPLQRSILDGAPLGMSVFRLDEGMDTGPIVKTATLDVEGSSPEGTTSGSMSGTAGELLRLAAEQGSHLLLASLDEAIITSATPQAGKPSLAPKLTRADGQLRATDGVEANLRRFRAMTPEPGAWLVLQGDEGELKVHSLVGLPEGTDSVSAPTPAQISVVNGRVLWGCADGALELLEVQQAGKTRMDAASWHRGRATHNHSGGAS